MPKHSISAAAGGLPKASRVELNECPVAALAHEAAGLRRVIDRLERQEAVLKDSERVAIGMQIQALYGRFYGIEDQATHLVATSTKGALYQCLVLFSLTDAWGKGKSEHKSKRMLFSLRTFLESAAAERIDGALGAYYMRAIINPHFLIAEALADDACRQEACV
jgi:hypothetical protein